MAYSIIDVLGNIEFVRDNVGTLSPSSPVVSLAAAVGGIAWLWFFGSREQSPKLTHATFYANREELNRARGGLERELKSVNEAWAAWLVGTHSHISDVFARTGKPQRLILLHPWNKHIKIVASLFERTPDELESAILITTRLAHRAGINVFWFDGPITSMLFGDPASDDAWLRIEIVFPLTVDRPNVIVSRRDSPELYDRLRQLFQTMLTASATDVAYKRIAQFLDLHQRIFRLSLIQANDASPGSNEEKQAEDRWSKESQAVSQLLGSACGENYERRFSAEGSTFRPLKERIEKQRDCIIGISKEFHSLGDAVIETLVGDTGDSPKLPAP